MHLLLEKAYIYPLPKTLANLEGCYYDKKKGYWIMEESKSPLILDPKGPKPKTKKCDVETGEDQKGE